ncbi:MAG: isoprenylcysteine carboxylmethyltransferase family protein [Clostridiales bacterium]|nr:isoprenylcysteine carboxylmethyltransferase family protein [Clostridiales bacterium]
MKKKQSAHLSFTGPGPYYSAIIVAMTVGAVYLSNLDFMQPFKIQALKIPFIVIGILLLIEGVTLWVSANFKSRLDKHIRNNQLVTTGVYAVVRNPIYTSITLACTGVLLFSTNALLLILPILYWAFLTVLLKYTEEKWLADLYKEEYLQYKKQVNRCIPWPSRRATK